MTPKEIWEEVREVAKRVPDWVRNSELHQNNLRMVKEALDKRVTPK